jgi:anthranilate synthase component 2
MAKILVFDNYDSFTYNLVHYVQKTCNHKVDVFLNDQLDLDVVEHYDGIILSPGPGVPDEAGLLKPLIDRYHRSKRIFGVCLGQQAIAEVFGGKLYNLKSVYHGVATPVTFSNPRHYLFDGLPETIDAGRYHSWVVGKEDFPDCLNIECKDKNLRNKAVAKQSSPGISTAADGVFLFGFIETLSKLRVMAVFTAFLLPFFFSLLFERM